MRGCAGMSRRWPMPTAWRARMRCHTVCRGRNRRWPSPTRPSQLVGRAASTCSPTIDVPRVALTTARSDFGDVYGDWAEIQATATLHRPHAPAALDGEVARPHSSKAAERTPQSLTDDEALALLDVEGSALDAARTLADDLRRDTVGDTVTYVVNRNINFTNVCYTGCRFCAFAQRRTDADAYTLSLDEVGRAGRGGVRPPARPKSACRAASTLTCRAPRTSISSAQSRSACPDMHVHAFSPDGGRQRGVANRPLDPGVAAGRAGGRGWTPFRARRRRSSMTTCAGC